VRGTWLPLFLLAVPRLFNRRDKEDARLLLPLVRGGDRSREFRVRAIGLPLLREPRVGEEEVAEETSEQPDAPGRNDGPE
jgi:hypothetical protein